MERTLKPTDKDQTEQHAQKQHEKKTVLIGSKILRPGHRCFEVNTQTLEVSDAKFETQVHFNAPKRRKIIIKESCVYVNALNAKNALKVYRRDYL
jgi:hypothetical protein